MISRKSFEVMLKKIGLNPRCKLPKYCQIRYKSNRFQCVLCSAEVSFTASSFELAFMFSTATNYAFCSVEQKEIIVPDLWESCVKKCVGDFLDTLLL